MNLLKKTLACSTAVIALTCPTIIRADEALADKQDYNPNLLIFTGEVRNFLELGMTAKNGNLEAAKEKAIVEEMGQTAVRIARVYFQEMTEENRSQLNTFLGGQLKSNTELNNYFILIGNAFATQAEKLVTRDQEYRKSIRIWSTVGGAVLGVALGGGYLYFKGVRSALNTTDYLVAGGALLLGAGLGYGGGLVYTHQIPIDRSVKNATDFCLRYPHGEDFLKDLNTSNLDLALNMSEVEGGE